jgi:hypothetical protein
MKRHGDICHVTGIERWRQTIKISFSSHANFSDSSEGVSLAKESAHSIPITQQRVND